jgi:hypothetical protein
VVPATCADVYSDAAHKEVPSLNRDALYRWNVRLGWIIYQELKTPGPQKEECLSAAIHNGFRGREERNATRDFSGACM